MNNLISSPQTATNVNYVNDQPDTKITIVGQHDFSVDGLASMLESRDMHFRVSCIEPDHPSLTGAAQSEPDVFLIQNEVLLEMVEPFIQAIVQLYPKARILIFGKAMDDERLYRLVRAGVHGYVNERMHGGHIKSAIDSVLAGNTWIERHIMARFISTQQQLNEALESRFQEKIERLYTSLTRRETEILCQVMKGLAIKQIAEEVHLSHQGVKMHLAKLFRKFKVSNRNQLILAAFDEISPVEELSFLLRDHLEKRLQHGYC